MKSFFSGRPQHDHPASEAKPAATGGLSRLGEAHSLAQAHAHAHASSNAQGGGATAGAPSVECIKQGDKVVRLIVTCSCGERIEVDCLYPNAG